MTGQPFDSPEARTAWIENLKAHIGDNVTVIEMDAHINDDAFATNLRNIIRQHIVKRAEMARTYRTLTESDVNHFIEKGHIVLQTASHAIGGRVAGARF